MNEEQFVEAAHTQYSDWTGTSAAEKPAGVVDEDLYDVLGVDRDLWHLAGLRISWELGAHAVAYVVPTDTTWPSPEEPLDVFTKSVEFALEPGDDGRPLVDLLRVFDRFDIVVTTRPVETMRQVGQVES